MTTTALLTGIGAALVGLVVALPLLAQVAEAIERVAALMP